MSSFPFCAQGNRGTKRLLNLFKIAAYKLTSDLSLCCPAPPDECLTETLMHESSLHSQTRHLAPHMPPPPQPSPGSPRKPSLFTIYLPKSGKSLGTEPTSGRVLVHSSMSDEWRSPPRKGSKAGPENSVGSPPLHAWGSEIGI